MILLISHLKAKTPKCFQKKKYLSKSLLEFFLTFSAGTPESLESDSHRSEMAPIIGTTTRY